MKGKTEKQKQDPKQIKDLTATLQRLQADFENYKKKVEANCKETSQYTKAELINKLLPVLDSFELALTNTNDSEKFKKGVELIFAQLFDTLEKEGLTPINSINEKFDPYKHEVMLKEKSDKAEGTVTEELQKGYLFKNKVLRHTKVKVADK